MSDTTTSDSNNAERRRWNNDYWTSTWPRREQLTGSVTEILLGHLLLQAGERVLDVGSGGGMTSLAAGRLVGAAGSVVGADISEPLVQLARQRAEERGVTNVTFVVADVQTEPLEGHLFDVAMSQFGVMFFDEPRVAFANILGHVQAGGRLAFVCWQPVAVNPWHIGNAVAPYVPAPPAPAPGKSATGPFSLGDASATTALLASAGWADVKCFPYQVTVAVGGDAIADDRQPAFMGVPEEKLAESHDALRRHLATFERGDGLYDVPLAYQVFTASKPSA
jgi:SAM-dependent methyltransferase